jgi:tol-pal system protein YbgF
MDTTPAPAVPAGAPQGSLGTLPASALPGEAGPLFAAAKAKLVQFDYAGAEQAFRAFLDEFGDDPQAGEAHYWLAESLYQQKAYAKSGAAYTTMIRSYPDDPRAPDALVKLARSMRLIGDKDKACVALDTLPKRYPNASGVTRDLAAVERTRSGCDN